MIVKRDNKWIVMDSSGKKVLGTHYSKEEAKDQLVAIELSKKRRNEIKESQKLLNNSMTNLTEYYKKLCEDLKIQRMVLEAKVKEEKEKKHKKSKKADKDYDGDGKVESGSEEYLGSRSNAIKKAVAKREGKELKEYTTRMQDPDDTGQPNEDDNDIMSMRRKAAEMGGITDDMVNEPLPGSSSLPGMDLTAQTPEQIDAANRGQTGVFGRPTTTRMANQSKSMSNLPTASAQRGKMVRPDAGDGLRRGSAPRKPSSGPTKFDLAQSVLNYVSGREAPKEGKVRNQDGKLVYPNTGNDYDQDNSNRIGIAPRRSKSIFDEIVNSNPSDLFFKKPEQDDPRYFQEKRPVLYSGLKKGLMGESTEYTIMKDTSMVDAAAQKIGDNRSSIEHLTHDNNTKIQLSENVIFGGFPQIKKD